MTSESDQREGPIDARRGAARGRGGAPPIDRARPPEAGGRARVLARAVALGLGLGLACTTPETALTNPSTGAVDPPPRASKTPPRTANPDRRGFDNQPDYDAEAAALREYVDPRLPTPIPSDPAAACAAMMAAADALYAAIETDPRRQEELQAALAASRDDDLAACARETSPRAAACVATLLADRSAELPWLLDQCSRAYPE